MTNVMQTLDAKRRDMYQKKELLTDTRAIAAYKKAISGTSIYRHAADYMRATFSFLKTVKKHNCFTILLVKVYHLSLLNCCDL